MSELGVGDVGVSTKGKEGSRGSKGNVEDLGEEEGKGSPPLFLCGKHENLLRELFLSAQSNPLCFVHTPFYLAEEQRGRHLWCGGSEWTELERDKGGRRWLFEKEEGARVEEGPFCGT